MNFEELFDGAGPVEPSSDLKGAAIKMFELYTALVGAGFTPNQAIEIISSPLKGDL